ncbi:MAG: acyl carrier protein [Oligoflexia bacterium]|nr:acyl carrier protein [Oligoflexia bacterium]
MSFNVDDKILAKVKEHLIGVCALNLQADEVDSDASIINKYGADSLDFLDLLFRLEEEFSIEIERGAIIKDAQGDLKEDEFLKDGFFTDKGLNRIKQVMVEIPDDKFPMRLKANDVTSLFTPKTFARIVSEQLSVQPRGNA